MEDLIEKFKEGWLEADSRVVIAVCAGIVVFILLNILHSKYQKNLQKLKQQAIDDKTVIVAEIKKRHRDRHTKSDFKYRAWYRYTVNGEEKEYVTSSSNQLPDTLELYPKNDACTKVFSDYDFHEGYGCSVNALAGIAVLIFILFITGYIGS